MECVHTIAHNVLLFVFYSCRISCCLGYDTAVVIRYFPISLATDATVPLLTSTIMLTEPLFVALLLTSDFWSRPRKESNWFLLTFFYCGQIYIT